VLLVLSVFAPFFVAFTVLQHEKKMVKKQLKWRMIEGLHRDELVLLSFTEAEKHELLRWKHTKEFEFKGEMYDIVEVEVVGDTTHYWCWWDHEETQLNRQLNQVVAFAFGQNPQSNDRRSKVLMFFKTLYFSFKPDTHRLWTMARSHCECGYCEALFKGWPMAPPVPPPECV
jgi:hypothetical protein